jgi:hypothetical protein
MEYRIIDIFFRMRQNIDIAFLCLRRTLPKDGNGNTAKPTGYGSKRLEIHWRFRERI